MRNNYIKISNNFMLVAISETEKQLLNDKANDGETQFKRDKEIENHTIIFDSTCQGVKEFFRNKQTYQIGHLPYFLDKIIEKDEEGFRNYSLVPDRAAPNWADELLRVSGGINYKSNFYVEDKNFYSQPEVIEAYQKLYPRPKTFINPIDSFISALKMINKDKQGEFVLVKIKDGEEHKW